LPTKPSRADCSRQSGDRTANALRLFSATGNTARLFSHGYEAVRLALQVQEPGLLFSAAGQTEAEMGASRNRFQLPKIDVTFASDPASFMQYSRIPESWRARMPSRASWRASHRRHEPTAHYRNVNYDPETPPSDGEAEAGERESRCERIR